MLLLNANKIFTFDLFASPPKKTPSIGENFLPFISFLFFTPSLLRVRNVDKNDFQYLRPYNTEELYGASQCVCAFDSLFIKT